MPTPDPLLDLRYPIGFPDKSSDPSSRAPAIDAVRTLPEQFAAALAGLSDEQLATPYREGGWTLRQLAHHVADSHMHAFLRTKFALTENWPVIHPYDEKRWAATGEVFSSTDAPMAILAGVHARWAALFGSLSEEDWQRGYVHPESGRHTLTQIAGLYSWHGRHHTAHVVNCRARLGI